MSSGQGTLPKPQKRPKPPPQNLRGTAPGTFVIVQSAEFGDEVREVLYRRDADRETRQTYNVPATRIMLLQGEPGSPPRVKRGPVIGQDPGESDGGTLVVDIERSHWPRLIDRAILFVKHGIEEDEVQAPVDLTETARKMSDVDLLEALRTPLLPEAAEVIQAEALRRMER